MKADGGPAFPRPHTIADANDQFFKLGAEGMSLRDYFAAKVICGIMAGRHFSFIVDVTKSPAEAEAMAARCAYDLADAMLKARDQHPTS